MIAEFTDPRLAADRGVAPDTRTHRCACQRVPADREPRRSARHRRLSVACDEHGRNAGPARPDQYGPASANSHTLQRGAKIATAKTMQRSGSGFDIVVGGDCFASLRDESDEQVATKTGVLAQIAAHDRSTSSSPSPDSTPETWLKQHVASHPRSTTPARDRRAGVPVRAGGQPDRSRSIASRRRGVSPLGWWKSGPS